MDLLKVILTALLSIASLFVITKLMGHKQVSQLDFFDYVSGITIGSIGAELATELERPLLPLIALAVWGGVSLFLNFLTRTLPKTRKYINGTPTVIMEGGKIYRENMKKARLDLSELMVLSREAGYFDLDDIGVAVFEYNGRLSILPRAEKRPLTPSDVEISAKDASIGVELIMDGEVLSKNLKRIGKSEDWLLSVLNKEGFRSPREIFLAVYKKEGKISLFPFA